MSAIAFFFLFSLLAMTQMIPEIVENPNKTTKWFVQFTLNVSIKAKILQRYYNKKERPACFFPFFPFDITTQLPFYVVQRLRIGESLSFHIVIFRTWWFVSWRRLRAIYNSLSKLLYRATSYRYMTGEIPLGPMIILGKFWRKNDRLFRGNSVSFKWTSWSQRLIRRPVVVKISAHHFI